MDPEQAREHMGRSTFLDVREQYEWDSGHVEGSLHIPIGQITTRVGELDGQLSIIVVCQVGQRSALVAEWLNDHGYEAQNLDGGLAAWHAHGLPLVAEAPERAVLDGWARDLNGGRINPHDG